VFLASSQIENGTKYGLFCYLKSQSDSCSLSSPVINGIKSYDTIQIYGLFGYDVLFNVSSSANGQLTPITNVFFNQDQEKLISLNIPTSVPDNISLQITAYAFSSDTGVVIEYIMLAKRDSSGKNALEGFLLFALTLINH
jgi:hypothetical protein